MKRKIKNGYVCGIIALVAVIGFSMAACSDGGGGGGSGGDPDLTGTVSISGTAQVGYTLTADTSSLGGSGTISYQWKRGTTKIGSNSNTYQVQSADVDYTITVTVTRSGYSGSVTSDPTDVITNSDLPALTGTVSISGTAEVGQTLTANTSSLDGSGTITYQWKRGTTVVGANSSTYQLTTDDINFTITVTVTRSGNSGSITSTPTATVIDSSLPIPALTGTVSISGFAGVEQILTANTDSLDGSGAIFYEWKRGGTVIGTGSSYTVQSADIGSTITVTVTRSGYSGSVTSAPTTIVTAEPPPTPGLAYTKINGDTAWSVSRGTAIAADVVIPALYEGLPVTAIANNGFSSYTNMTNIRIPDRVTNIGSNAFYNCTGLTSVTIPNSVISIGIGVFTGCTGLTSVTVPFLGNSLSSYGFIGLHFGASSYSDQNSYIPASLKTVIITGGNSVPAGAFSGCTRLTSITIPNSVLSIGQSAFSGCTGLPSITIPDSVLSIGQSAFSDCTGLESVTIPTSVTSIGQSAFSGCTGLPSITIPDSVTSIGDSAFRNCTSLESITLPFTGKGEGATRSYEKVFGYIFGYTAGVHYYPSSSSDSPQPSGTTYQAGETIYSGTGYGAYNDYYYYIPASLKTVVITGYIPEVSTSTSNGSPYDGYGGAFRNCTNLTSITIPNSVTSIGDNAFYKCSGLTSVTIPNGVTSIGGSAFSGCSGLTSVTIPNGVTSIGGDAFYGCTGLTSINFNATAMDDASSSVFGGNTGQNAGGITVNIGANVTKIPANLFRSGVKITTVNFAAGSVCKSIGGGAFSYCTDLTSVTIPTSVTSIGDSAFYSCSGLTSVTIPNGVTSIGSSTFYGCSGLTSITIPNGVTSIGDKAFSNCTGLTSITFNATAMGDLNYTSNLFNNAGQNADGITVNIGANVTKIPVYLFYYESKITAVNFAAGSVCKSIGGDAFSGCTGLTSVTIPNGVTSIGGSAFNSCTGLTSVTIPNSVTSIGSSAFNSCTGLTSVIFQGIIPSSGFDYNAFYIGDLRAKFYATNSTNGTPGTYVRTSGSNTWMKQS